MKNKLKKIINSKLFVFLVTALIFSSAGVYAATYFPSIDVTYDNKTSGLASTDVQGAIDELYKTCTAEPPKGGDGILDKEEIVTSGDGLYKDEDESGKYIYKGTSPNNFINFNNETWRIISLEPDGRIKILRNSLLDTRMEWDTDTYDTTEKHWDKPVKLNEYLNGDYLNTMIDKNKIFSSDWSIGTITSENDNLNNQIIDENKQKWNGKVGLISVSEYLKTNTNTNQCNNLKLYTKNYSICCETSWMYIDGEYFSLITPVEYYNSYYRETWYVIPFLYLNGELHLFSANVTAGIRPAVYLSADIKITGGDGSQNNPYTIE